MYKKTMITTALGLGIFMSGASLASEGTPNLDESTQMVRSVTPMRQLPHDIRMKIFSYCRNGMPVRAVCAEWRDLVDIKVGKYGNSLLVLRLPRWIRDDENLEGKEKALEYLIGYLARILPLRMQFNLRDLTGSEQSQIFQSCAGLKSLRANELHTNAIASLPTSLRSLTLTDPEFANLRIFRPADFVFSHMNFSHLNELQSVSFRTEFSPQNLELDMSMYPASLNEIVFQVPSFGCRRERFRLTHCENLRNLNKLKKFSIPCQLVSESNFADLTVLNADSIEELNLSGCPLIQDFTPLAQMPNLRSLVLTTEQRNNLPDGLPITDEEIDESLWSRGGQLLHNIRFRNQ